VCALDLDVITCEFDRRVGLRCCVRVGIITGDVRTIRGGK